MTFPSVMTPLLTADLEGIGGRIKVQPEDFEVEEIPAYQPSGEGEYLYLWIEKHSMGAEFFVRQIAQRLGIGPGEVGTAGLKDRHAVTRQMVSVPVAIEANLGQLDGNGIRVLSVSKHSNKLKPGHLHGNKFRILVRDVVPNATELLPALVERIRENGLPNFYGSQRFGRDGETLKIGWEQFTGTGRRINPFLRKFALSAVQSALFNEHVAGRMRDGLFRTVIAGDVMAKWPFGGMFVAKDVPTEQERFNNREIIHTGPMFGKKMYPCGDDEAVREANLLQAAGLTPASFHGFGKLLSGTRRYTLIYIDDLAGTMEPDGVRLTFTLPSGSYATVLLRELTHSDNMEGEDTE